MIITYTERERERERPLFSPDTATAPEVEELLRQRRIPAKMKQSTQTKRQTMASVINFTICYK